MKTNISIILFLFFTINLSYSQDNKHKSDKHKNHADTNKIDAFWKKSNLKSFIKGINISGRYVAPIFKYGYINGRWSAMWGAQGGVMIDRKFGVGLKGVWIINQEFKNSDDQTRYLALGYGGPYIEYIHNIESFAHLSSHLGILFGRAKVKDSRDYANFLNREYYFILEPGVNAEVNLASFLILAINAEYRFTIGPDLNKDVSVSNLSGFNFGITLKFGKF